MLLEKMKYVIVSCNANSDYEFYLPLVKWAWKKLGWEVIVMWPFPAWPYREETITQCIRLYAALLPQIKDDDLLMTSDADMIPLSDYWKPDADKITTYGHDLTGYQHVPMCYIAMTAANWKKVMNLNGQLSDCLLNDLSNSKALSEERTEWWGVDQDIITERLSHHDRLNINRGIEPDSYLPKGRFDRAGMQYPKTPLIDLHAPREGWNHWEMIKEVITKAFGECPAELMNIKDARL